MSLYLDPTYRPYEDLPEPERRLLSSLRDLDAEQREVSARAASHQAVRDGYAEVVAYRPLEQARKRSVWRARLLGTAYLGAICGLGWGFSFVLRWLNAQIGAVPTCLALALACVLFWVGLLAEDIKQGKFAAINRSDSK